ncbi:MAG TPA: DoxX family protein [Candidatus Methylomirabilis sp.]|nr:DoxX family protein [Candidatus Methylomirabilis sp.]
MSTHAMLSTMTARPAAGLRARIKAITTLLGRFPLAIHQFLFRLAIAGVFLRAGLIKMTSWQSTIALFRDEYKVPVLPPEIAAVLGASFEIGCSVLLVLGLASRLATLPLMGMILTIQLFVYPDAWPEHLVWGSILAFLLTRGPGSLSLDHLIGLETGAPEAAQRLR